MGNCMNTAQGESRVESDLEILTAGGDSLHGTAASFHAADPPKSLLLLPPTSGASEPRGITRRRSSVRRDALSRPTPGAGPSPEAAREGAASSQAPANGGDTRRSRGSRSRHGSGCASVAGTSGAGSVKDPPSLPIARNGVVAASGRRQLPPAKAVETDYVDKLIQGVQVVVIPMTRTGIECKLRYEVSGRRLVLSKNSNRRAVDLKDIQRVMFSRKDLLRVENQAAMADDANCCAILLKSRNCIGLRWATVDERQHFVAAVEYLVRCFGAGIAVAGGASPPATPRN